MFPLMTPLSEAEFAAVPSYLRNQLQIPLSALNDCLNAVNECVTDKRFDGLAADYVTADEISQLLRLGGRSRTLLLLLIHCGRLRALDAKRADGSASAPGLARYKIAGGGGGGL